MRPSPRIRWICAGVVLSLFLPVCGSYVATVLLPNRVFQQIPLHSLLEAAGGLMAVAIACILITERPRKADSDYFPWIASALLAMGTLDLYHAGVEPGAAFVWLHSTATMVGGALLACVWLPSRWTRGWFGQWLPWGSLAAALIFGGCSALAGSLPPMVINGGFSLLAQALNIGGGVGFLIAGAFFIGRFHRHQQNSDWLFALHAMLFGAAAVLFELSQLWDAAWWWWHILRLTAYLAALIFAGLSLLDAERTLLGLNRDLTELNRTLDQTVAERTAKLRASEERYALAVRGSTDGLWDWTVPTGDVYYSPRFKELLGFHDHEFPNLFSSFESRLHPDDLQRTLAAIHAHLESQAPYDVQYRLRTKTGAYRWYRARGQAVWDDAGKPWRMAGSITDITKRKQAEAALEHERFLLHTLFEHIPDAIYFKDVAGRFMRVTSSLAKRLGAANPQEVVGKSDADFFPADYADQARADEQQLMQSGQPMIGKEEQPHWADHGEQWVSTTKVPLRSEAGEIIGAFGISHDITEHKLAEERFRRVIDAAPYAMVVVNAQGRIQLVNAATESMFGYSREELIQGSVEMLVPESARAGHVALREDYLRQPAPRPMGPGRQLRGRRKDGSELPIEIGLSPVALDGQTLVLGSIHDVTLRRQAEDALVAAKEAAESSNRAKSDFLANMSHEIRTPMNAIIGMTELVLDTEINKTQRDYLTIVLESAESLLSIINQILDFSKIEAGRLVLESLEFDLYDELGDTLKSIGPRAHAKHLELALHIEQDVPRYLRGDAGRLRQVLINLVGNAIKFTEQGEVVVEVGVQELGDSRVRLLFAVRDTGIGVPKAKQEHVFAAFEQADSSTTRRFGGTGLGLAISARIVEAMQGKIWIESTPGKGSTFQFIAEFSLTAAIDAVEQEPAYLEGQPIVIVDDNQTNRLILKEMAESWGMRVHSAANAEAAVQLLEQCRSRSQSPPMLISDVHMPDMDGFMLAEELRSRPELKDTVIILLTSGGHATDAERSQELGIAGYLLKPVKQSELLETICSASGKRRQVSGVVEEADDLPQLPPQRILVVEDGKANQILALGLLKKWGHQVVLAEDGEEALERWREQTFDVILMDVQMPVMDGLEATRRIRLHEANVGGRVPIIAMTARAMKGDRQRCLEAGMDSYVAKPVRRHELHSALVELLPPDHETTPTSLTTTAGSAAQEAVSNSPAAALVDWEEALNSVAGDPEILHEVTLAAAKELPELCQALRDSLVQRDLAAMHRLVHTLRSSSRIFAATAVETAAAEAEAETAAWTNDGHSSKEFEVVEAACGRLLKLVPELVRELRSRG